MYDRYIKRKLPAYLAFAALFSVLLAADLMLIRRNKNLETLISKAGIAEMSGLRIKRDTAKLRERLLAAKKQLPEKSGSYSDRDQLLLALDHLQDLKEGTSVTIGELTRGPVESAIAIEESFSYAGFSPLLQRIDSLECLQFPFFRLQQFTFERDDKGKGTCRVKGHLVTPVSAMEG